MLKIRCRYWSGQVICQILTYSFPSLKWISGLILPLSKTGILHIRLSIILRLKYDYFPSLPTAKHFQILNCEEIFLIDYFCTSRSVFGTSKSPRKPEQVLIRVGYLKWPLSVPLSYLEVMNWYKLYTYPSPKPKTVKWWHVSINVGFRKGLLRSVQVLTFIRSDNILNNFMLGKKKILKSKIKLNGHL